MKIGILKNKRDYLEEDTLDNYTILKDIPNANYKDYFSKTLIIDDEKYVSVSYNNKTDVLAVKEFEDKSNKITTFGNLEDGDLETFDEHEPTCPICGYEYQDAFELEDETEIDCPNCHAQLEVTREVSVSYTTKVISGGETLNLDEEENSERNERET